MKIVIKTLDNTRETVLADGFSRGTGILCGPSDLRVSDSRECQVELKLRAENQSVFDRMNSKFGIQFGSTIRFSSLPEALIWQVNFHLDCVRFGNLILMETNASGQQSKTQLSRAHISACDSLPLGLTRKITFKIVGEKLSRL